MSHKYVCQGWDRLTWYEKSLCTQRRVIPSGDLGKTSERVTAPPPPRPPPPLGLKRRSALAGGDGEHSSRRESEPRESSGQAQGTRLCSAADTGSRLILGAVGREGLSMLHRSLRLVQKASRTPQKPLSKHAT